jgi:hypothetical protein
MTDDSLNPYAAPISAEPVPALVQDQPDDTEPRGIGGWLVLSLLGVIVFGAVCCVGLVRNVLAWEQLLAAFRRQPFPWFIAAHLLLISGIFTTALLGIVGAFKRDRRTPKLIIAFYALQAAFFVLFISLGADYGYSSGSEGSENADYKMGYLIGSGVLPLRCLAWIAYYLRSKRVRNTFVN